MVMKYNVDNYQEAEDVFIRKGNAEITLNPQAEPSISYLCDAKSSRPI